MALAIHLKLDVKTALCKSKQILNRDAGDRLPDGGGRELGRVGDPK
jgi:hypothetical protein